MAAPKKESLKTALRKYQRSEADKREDVKNAKKLQAKDNAKASRMSSKKGKC
ncbi:hypothetical protein [Paraburkholderia caballeronis]|uniref:hypothetical protein n=1 Tax=Paraburkholderia caballeronis TaxID=416943 RepID=UPI0010F22514|nr:hypothetical protein [Paraburkholderia caballeronis]TDV06053.1 hypothetical protein C7408_12434 [Paraburkholderia caballeronis]TDV09593.1 hypothetical protein C7406_12634 [Paraburkholderia caballeronis]TDV21658.1 hypothetical protein C7404_12134 [Paraburkholderia caballeronis]